MVLFEVELFGFGLGKVKGKTIACLAEILLLPLVGRRLMSNVIDFVFQLLAF